MASQKGLSRLHSGAGWNPEAMITESAPQQNTDEMTDSPALPSHDWKLYRLFGMTLASNYRPLERSLGTATGTPDITFSCEVKPPVSINWQKARPDWEGWRPADEGEDKLALYRFDNLHVLRFKLFADFYLFENRIVCHLIDQDYRYLVEVYFLGTVIAYFLERKGFPVFHASAVSINNRAVAFLSTSKGGKSVLAASFMQAGYAMLTDDILALEFSSGRYLARPGYSSMRLWPEECKAFLGTSERMDIVHPGYKKLHVPVGLNGYGKFCDNKIPLDCIYIPDRYPKQDNLRKIDIVPLNHRETVIELIRNSYSFAAHLAEPVGFQIGRFNCLGIIARVVPIKKIVYPSGQKNLERVKEAIIKYLVH